MIVKKSIDTYVSWEESKDTWETCRGWEIIRGYLFEGYVNEELGVSDRLKRCIEKRSIQCVLFSDTYIDHIRYFLRFIEKVMLYPQIGKEAECRKDECLDIDGAFAHEASKCSKESLLLGDMLQLNALIHRLFFSEINLRERLLKKANLKRKEIIKTFDLFRKKADVHEKQSVHVMESSQRVAAFKRYLHEQVKYFEHNAKNYRQYTDEDIKAFGDMLHSPDVIISDIVFSDSPEDFEVPAGYTDFRPFLPGDYTYQKALFKLLAKTSVAEKRALIDEFSVHVDLPDIQDRGTSVVEKGGTVIAFSRQFYVVPEVTITMRAASGAIPVPVIQEVTRTYFKVQLLTPSGNPSEGTICWTALGC